MKILIAVDGSEYTQRMLAYLHAHRDFPGPGHSYTVLNIVQPVPYRAAAFMNNGSLETYYADEAGAVLDPIREQFRADGVEATCVHVVGMPADEIAAYAQQHGFDLLVMGTHGHGALASLVLGSVVSKVLAHCGVPVLLVR